MKATVTARSLTPSSMQRKRQMMMVDDIVPALRTENHRDNVLAEEPFAFFCSGLAPALALGLNFAHADRDLRRTQIGDGDRSHHRFADPVHLIRRRVDRAA